MFHKENLEYNRHQVGFYTLDELVPKDHFLRKVDKEGSIISVVGKTTVEIIALFWMYPKSPIRTIMKSDKTIIRKNLWDLLRIPQN